MTSDVSSAESFPDTNLSHRGESPSPQGLARLAWLPVPVVFLLTMVLSLSPHERLLGLLPLFPLFNLAFLTLVAVAVSVLAAGSYLACGSLTLLFLGSGALAYGTTSLLASGITSLLASYRVAGGGYNLGATIYWPGITVAGFLCLLSAGLQASTGGRPLRASPAGLAAAYAAVLAAMAGIYLCATRGLLPPFFVEGVGPTALRQILLAVAFAEFGAASLLLWVWKRHNPSAFLHWYALGLALTALGLLGAIGYKHYDSVQAWAARGSLYVGGVYLLAAVVAARRESGRWMIPLATLYETYDRYTRLVNASPDAILVLAEGEVVFANPAAENLFGVSTRRPLLSARLLDLVSPDCRSDVEDFLGTSLSRGQTAPALEAKVLRPDGPDVDVELSAVPVTDAGQPAVQVVLRDITERKRAQAALAEQREELQLILDAAPSFIFYKDRENQFVRVNSALAGIMGMPKEQLEGRSVFDVYPREQAEAFWSDDQEVMASGRPKLNILERMQSPAGDLWVQTDKVPYRDAAGNVIGILGFSTDVTDRRRAEEALQRERDLLQAVMDGARSSHLVYLDREFRFVRVNDVYARTCGYRPEEMVGKNHFALYPHAENEAIFARVRDTGEPAEFRDKPFEYPDHPERGVTYWDWTLTPVRGAGGEVEGLVFALHETTERKRAEEELRQSQAMFATLFRSSPALISVSRLEDGVLLEVNRAYTELLGYERDEVVGRSALEFLYPAPSARERILETRGPDGRFPLTETEFLAKDGRLRCFVLGGETVEFGGEQLLVAAGIDITERRRAEEELAAAKRAADRRAAELQAMMEVLPVGVFVGHDPGCREITANRAGYDLLRLDPASNASKQGPQGGGPGFRVLREGTELSPSELPMAVAAARGHEVLGDELEILFPDGTKRELLVSAAPLFDEAGTPRGAVAAMVDISDQARLRRELRAAKEAAEAANRAKSDFLARMSHEIRTPMNGVLGMTALALLEEITPKAREFLLLAKSSAGSLLEIINDILDLSRIEAGRVELHETEFGLRNLLQLVVGALQPGAKDKGLRLHHRVSPDVPEHLLGDEGRLRQVLTNLIGNALKFTKKGEVEVTVQRVSDSAATSGRERLLFSVRDTGIGIPEDKLETVFGAFEQASRSTHAEYEGTGLGLAITKELVALMGGEVWVESRPGQGSTFRFTVELALDERADEAEVPPGRPRSPAEIAKLRVLLVEDDPVSRLISREFLTRDGHEAVVAEDGARALEELGKGAFDVILLDVELPVLGGLETLRRIRAGDVPGCPTAVPVVAITAQALRGDRERFLAAGMDAYLPKPVDIDGFRSVLAEVVGRRGRLPTTNQGASG